MKIKLTLSYDGTEYCGWQVQPNGISVQQVIEQAIFTLTGEKVKVTGSGRTDAGVHALGQVADFTTNSTIPPQKFALALNTILPSSVKVVSSEQVKDDFSAIKSAKRKTYQYNLYVSAMELPLKERYALRIDEVDVLKMQSACKILIGEHDFKCMCAVGSSAKTTVREIYDLSVAKNEQDIVVSVTGNGFLYNMVRIMVGTLLEIGYGKMTEQDLKDMLSSGQRAKGGKTISAKGLVLKSVE